MPRVKPKILRLEPMTPETSSRLEKEFHSTLINDLNVSVSEFITNFEEIRGIATPGNIGVSKLLMESLPNLEIVSCFGVGYDGIDLEYCRDNDVIVTNTPNVLTDCVADLGMGLILAVMRRITQGDRYVRADRWPNEGILALGTSPRGKQLGIVGLGRIGSALAGYHNRTKKPDVEYKHFPNLQGLAENSDVLVLTCPGGAATQHLIDDKILEALGRKGILINIARGSVVDEKALVQALKAEIICGAGLDVFENEPHVPKALFGLENVVIQPHQASATIETRKAMGDLTVDNLLLHFSGRAPLTPVHLD